MTYNIGQKLRFKNEKDMFWLNRCGLLTVVTLNKDMGLVGVTASCKNLHNENVEEIYKEFSIKFLNKHFDVC